jgi:hypothetical protein
MRLPVVFTAVDARDRETARILAAERFAQSAAILDLVFPPKVLAGREMLVAGEHANGISSSRDTWIIRHTSGTQLAHPFDRLARAAGHVRQTDWERRLLAAARWHSRSARSTYTAERLTSVMVALECMLVAGKGNKGRTIAEGFTNRLRLHEMATPEDQIDWLIRLYRGRNAAAHEGLDYRDDVLVDRLVEATRTMVIRFVYYLDPAHVSPGRECRTFDEAMSRSLADVLYDLWDTRAA